jgi:hypothetical protein
MVVIDKQAYQQVRKLENSIRRFYRGLFLRKEPIAMLYKGWSGDQRSILFSFLMVDMVQ